MANREASSTFRLSGDTVPLSMPSVEVLVPFTAIQGGDLDVPDLTAADTVYAIPFGACAEASHVQIQNNAGQDVLTRIGGAAVTGTLASGTVTIAFPAVAGERLSVEMVTSGGTPGVLSVKRSSGNVIVQSWLLGTGIQASDTSIVRVHNNAPVVLTDGGMLCMSNGAAGSGVTAAEVVLTDAQDGAGTIEAAVAGDPI